ncbi:putative RING finger protein P32A8.03c like [Verticillium longisporum]|uniref:RING-type E3 ubiquitin transferase n=1 Tax=Verticillium longisporum TaxID=100787 RepID=A0A8I3AXT6_VERLO|nr:putative RING finger protein P32A8.03c like [Verticillium longisporum]
MLANTNGKRIRFMDSCARGAKAKQQKSFISQENDPRDFHDAPSPLSSGDGPRGPRRADSDSDPDEADIEEHLHPHGFNIHRSTWGNPHGDEQGGRQPPDPANGDQVIGRFLELLSTFGHGAQGGGRARAFGRPSEDQAQGQGHDDFQSVFSNILTGAGPPQQPDGEDMPGQGPRPRAAGAQNLAASLHQILNMLAPGNGQFGDAVYTQEALDRIISNMMETNPQSNAAPPASEDAIGKLQRKAVDDEMLGPEGMAECTICIDELKKGEEVVYLPCKHWFHDTCVVMWLKEHNTCPICRTPIEERTESASGGQQGDGGEGSGRPAPGPSNSAPPGGGQPPPFFGFGMPSPHGDGAPPPNSTGGWGYAAPPQPPHPSTRPVHTRQFHWSFQLPQNGPVGNTRGEGSSRSPRGYDIFPPRPKEGREGRLRCGLLRS